MKTVLYYTWTISTSHAGAEYYILSFGLPRKWSKKIENGMSWSSPEEAKDAIKLFKIPNCNSKAVPHYE